MTFISQIYYVSETQVALSCQFLNKSKINIHENPFVSALVTNPKTFDGYRLQLKFVESQTKGPTFDTMRTKIEAIASMTGMENIFKLQSSEIFDVLEVESIDGVLEGQ